MDKQATHGPVGRRFPREDAEAKIKGQLRFLTDIRMEGMLHARQVPGRLPHARLLALKLNAARSAPGVAAVISAAEVPGENRVGVIIDDQPLLAEGKLRYQGEPVAVLAAETPEEAAAAVELVEQELEALPIIAGLDDVEPAPADPVHERGPIAVHNRLSKGDTARGFTEADEVVEVELETGPQEHYYLEPLGVIAVPEAGGGLTIYGTMQCPFYVQKAVARVAGLAQSRVRVIQTPTGGAFGGKEDLPSEIAARAALLALATDRPVRLVLERREDVEISSLRHPFRIRGRLGATRDGRFTALELWQDADSGAYATLSPPVIYRACMQGAGPYVIPNVKIATRGWYTNNAPSGAFRGFGSPQSCFGHESLVDKMADALGMDPAEIRRVNMLREGGETGTGHRLDTSVGALECLDKASAAAFAEAPTPPDASGRWLTGTGLASMIYGNCLGKAGWHMDGAAALLQLHADGSLNVATGLTEMGQGARTVVIQMAAEALGVLPETIQLAPVDTALIPDSGPTVASRNVVMSGRAILDAAGKLHGRLRPLAAKMLDCLAEAVAFTAGEVSGGGKTLAFGELCAEASARNLDLAATGWWHVPELDFDMKTGLGEAYFAYSFATQAVSVAVDRVTGNVKVLKVWAAHDVGRAVNPAGVEAQVEGGVAQGIGLALTEHFVREGGVVISRNLSTYYVPTAIEVPEIETIIVEEPHPEGPFGAKSLGEPVIIPTAAALAAAVSNAVGAPVTEIPITPETVLELLEKGGHGDDALL